ncbi:hypothetical protein [Actinomyces ruminis]|uniref:hypothetical protein n=1 Tax=Actinomyces ruminis TaxID=1937003 RepID=UPI001177F978|nr:hypothetical protein [Actinomyces ruminis]
MSETLTQESQAQGLTIAGKDSHSLDLRADRGDSPIFVRETTTITDYSGDYRILDGSPADGSGKPLSTAVASALGLPAGTTVDRGALVNAAWDTSTADLGSNTRLSDGIWGDHFETAVSGGWGASWSVAPAARFSSGTDGYGVITMQRPARAPPPPCATTAPQAPVSTPTSPSPRTEQGGGPTSRSPHAASLGLRTATT